VQEMFLPFCLTSLLLCPVALKSLLKLKKEKKKNQISKQKQQRMKQKVRQMKEKGGKGKECCL
jgi:hypothetical protein